MIEAGLFTVSLTILLPKGGGGLSFGLLVATERRGKSWIQVETTNPGIIITP